MNVTPHRARRLLRRKRCDHTPIEECEEWIRNESVVAWATIEGRRIPIAGYIVRCRRCQAEYPVMVG